MAADSVFACVGGGSIWEQYGGVGLFIDLEQTPRRWKSVCYGKSGDQYAATIYNAPPVTTGDIYKRANGVGDFEPMGFTTQSSFYGWSGISVGPDGTLWAVRQDSTIFKQANGVGDLVSTGVKPHTWANGIVCCPLTNDIYVSVYGVGIYQWFNGLESSAGWVAEARNWGHLAANPVDGFILCPSASQALFGRVSRTGTFEQVAGTSPSITGVGISRAGYVFISSYSGIWAYYNGLYNPVTQIETTARSWTSVASDRYGPQASRSYATIIG